MSAVPPQPEPPKSWGTRNGEPMPPPPDFGPPESAPWNEHCLYALGLVHDVARCGLEGILDGTFDPEFLPGLIELLQEALDHWRFGQTKAA